MRSFERLEKMMTGELAGPPIANLLGYKITAVSTGKVTLEMIATDAMHNRMGTLHGGVFGDLADAAMGYAFSTTLNSDQIFTSMDMTLNFLKPVFEGKLRAEGQVIKRGATTGLVECDIFDDKNSLVAHATGTCLVIENNPGAKRERKV